MAWTNPSYPCLGTEHYERRSWLWHLLCDIENSTSQYIPDHGDEKVSHDPSGEGKWSLLTLYFFFSYKQCSADPAIHPRSSCGKNAKCHRRWCKVRSSNPSVLVPTFALLPDHMPTTCPSQLTWVQPLPKIPGGRERNRQHYTSRTRQYGASSFDGDRTWATGPGYVCSSWVQNGADCRSCGWIWFGGGEWCGL